MFRRKRSAEDFAEEIKAHLELEADELRREGLSEDEARRKARREFGNVRAAQERFYMEAGGRGWTSGARCAVWDAVVAAESGICADGDIDTGAGNGREHGGIQRDECGAAAVVAGGGSGRVVYLRTSNPPRGTGTIDSNETFSYPVYDALRSRTRAIAGDGLRAAVGQQGRGAHRSAAGGS